MSHRHFAKHVFSCFKESARSAAACSMRGTSAKSPSVAASMMAGATASSRSNAAFGAMRGEVSDSHARIILDSSNMRPLNALVLISIQEWRTNVCIRIHVLLPVISQMPSGPWPSPPGESSTQLCLWISRGGWGGGWNFQQQWLSFAFESDLK